MCLLVGLSVCLCLCVCIKQNMSIKFNACPDAHCVRAFLHLPVFHGNRPSNFDMLLPGQPTERISLHHVCYKLRMQKKPTNRNKNFGSLMEKCFAELRLKHKTQNANKTRN